MTSPTDQKTCPNPACRTYCLTCDPEGDWRGWYDDGDECPNPLCIGRCNVCGVKDD